MLPNLQAECRAQVVRLSDSTLALRTDVVADDSVDAYRQSAAGNVLQVDSRVRHSHGGPTWSSGNLRAAALGETGAGNLSAARAA